MESMLRSKILFRVPNYLPPSAWIGHLPFAAWLIEACEPRTIVELGTHAGTSYMGFCQAVTDLGLSTRCYAVDTWQGDDHAGHYGDEVYQTLKRDHDALYSEFSTLLRMTFDSALENFEDGSVDILHIDGLHTYDAVSHDFHAWRSKLSDRAVVLFHDVCEVDFGVQVFWKEIRKSFPGFLFTHSHGLGVLFVGKDVSPRLISILGDVENEDALRNLFSSLGGLVESELSRQHFERLVVIREREISDMQSLCETMQEARTANEAELNALRVNVESLSNSLDSITRAKESADQALSDLQCALSRSEEQSRNTKFELTERIGELMRQYALAEKGLAERETMIASISAELAGVRNQLSIASADADMKGSIISEMRRSRSWRYTKLLRALAGFIRSKTA